MCAPTSSTAAATIQEGYGKNFICGVVEGFYGRPWTNDQRHDLFSWMRKFGVTTYLYAPKDDVKHRFEWRKLHTSEELDLLKSLIDSAKECNIDFVYSLSPGLDIIYSKDDEIKAIKEKFDQVRCIGCEAFALLFDDVEAVMQDVDKSMFSSFALAQVTVTNLIYEYLNRPVFYFCPTEYCESRAYPTLHHSEYLREVGEKLLQEINIFWTGPRIVSKSITIEHIRRVAEVLRRKPLIWDNLHANDYDAKRIHLGPFIGRSAKLKREVVGVLINPNCRHEANFVPLYSFAEWIKCEGDVESEDCDAIVDEECTGVELSESRDRFRLLYHPIYVLDEGLKLWSSHLSMEVESAPCVSQQMETETLAAAMDKQFLDDNVGRPLYKDISSYFSRCSDAETKDDARVMNSLTVEYIEPMEIATLSKDDLKVPTDSNSSVKMSNQDIMDVSSDISMESSATTINNCSRNSVKLEHLSAFVDLYYLPFVRGRNCLLILEEFTWLRENSSIMRRKSEIGNLVENMESTRCEEWQRRCECVLKSFTNIRKFYQSMILLPNKAAVQELFQYAYELHGIISMLEGVLLWMADGELMISNKELDRFWLKQFADDEPWLVSDGALSDLLKLLFNTSDITDLIALKSVIPMTLDCITIRPYNDVDEKEIYSLISADADSLPSNEQYSTGKRERFFDRYVGSFIHCADPRTSFVAVEVSSCDAKRISALACSVLNSRNYHSKMQHEYIPKMRSKYSELAQKDDIGKSSDHELRQMWQTELENIDDWLPLQFSDQFYRHFPSQIEIRWRNANFDAVAVRRLICTSAAALSYNGSTGIFMILKSSEEERINLCIKLGLIPLNESVPDGYVLLGHLL